MTRLTSPSGLQDITPSWLTETLNHEESLSGPSVSSYSVEIIGEGKGFMNQIARLRLAYDDESGNSPDTVIIKLPSTDLALKSVTDKLEANVREVRFYQEIAPRANLHTPHCYYAAADPTTGHAVLVLEDMGDARQGDSVAGCSLTEVELAISELARFQASWWENPQLSQFHWLPSKNAESSSYQEMYSGAWRSLLEQAGTAMPPELQALGNRLGRHIPMIKGVLGKSPQTIIHGDYRLDNCFLGPLPGAPPLVVFDWQFCGRGRGVYDVATFISEALPPQDRRGEEMGLLRMYHARLLEQDVDDYPFEKCLQDYRLSMLGFFVFWIVVGGYCDFTGDRATTYLQNSLERINAAIVDLDCADLLYV